MRIKIVGDRERPAGEWMEQITAIAFKELSSSIKKEIEHAKKETQLLKNKLKKLK